MAQTRILDLPLDVSPDTGDGQVGASFAFVICQLTYLGLSRFLLAVGPRQQARVQILHVDW